jgi:large subunit ribosomal protein L27
MAHIKTGGTTKGNKDSVAKRLGVKKYGGEKVLSGNIIIRQTGTKFHSGKGTKMGNDYTIFAVKSGNVKFVQKEGDKFAQVI